MRRVLKPGKRDKIHNTLRSDGEVGLTRIEAPDADDAVLAQFLSFLAADTTHHPGRLQFVDSDFVQRLQFLVRGVNVDLDEALCTDDA